MTKKNLTLLFTLLIVSGSLFAGEVEVPAWLAIGPLPLQQTAFADSVPTAEQILEQRYLTQKNRYWPSENDRIGWAGSGSTTWTKRKGNILTLPDGSYGNAVAFAAAYLTSDRWQKLSIKASSSRPVLLYIEGKESGKCSEANDEGTYELSADYTAHTGKHTLIFKTVDTKELTGGWTLSAKVEVDDGKEQSISWSSDPSRAPTYYGDYAMFESLSKPAISRDGKYVAVLRSERDNDEYKKHTWIDIVEAASGRHIETIRMEMSLGNPAFLRRKQMLTFTSQKDGKTTLWKYAVETKELTKLLEDVENFTRAQVSNDGLFVYYEVEDEKPDNEENYTLYQEIADRVTDYSELKRLYVKSLVDGSVRPVTALGDYNLENWRLSPQDDKLFLIRCYDQSVRPYFKYEFWVYDIATGEAKHLETRHNIEYPVSLTWISDNEVAYAFGSHDASVKDTVYHNASNLVLYVLNFDEGKSRALTADAELCLPDEYGHKRIYWNPKDKMIWFHAIVGGHRKMMKISPDGSGLQEAIKTRYDFIEHPVLSTDGTMIAYIASSSVQWGILCAQKTSGGSEKQILDPNHDLYGSVIFGWTDEWDFVNKDGYNIDGWLHVPADFTEDKQWPLIVYYYGGVSPRNVGFSFTYQWWLANGYCVYVLNPVGAYGYGQELADKHANDWGKLATRDIIEGTEKILEAKPFLDRNKVGAYGGSYGGFLTLDLVSRTDIFAAAVDMYGISNITSYFGGGIWGHWYSEIASPGSFPWSHDIYNNRSPLYNAETIHTPLLLLHGAADDNVPALESDQMFVVLKLLGQDVVYAKFQDEGHGIVNKFENYIEHREMMLEWFDKYLKGQPEAWEARLEQEK